MNVKLGKKHQIPPPLLMPHTHDDQATVMEREAQKVEPPPMFRVILLNDDYTPMEFVVMVIQEFFYKDQETATRIMLQVHIEGKGVCGVYTADVAATKVQQVTDIAREAGHPLQCTMEDV